MMHKGLYVPALLWMASAGCMAAQQISQQEIDRFDPDYIGNITVSATNESITSPSDLQQKLSELADKKGGNYYHIVSAREQGANFVAIAEVFK